MGAAVLAESNPMERKTETMERRQADVSPRKDSLHIFHPSFNGQGIGKIRNLAARKKIGRA
jgi:hypothetical protein